MWEPWTLNRRHDMMGHDPKGTAATWVEPRRQSQEYDGKE